jgi:hypothetical protein
VPTFFGGVTVLSSCFQMFWLGVLDVVFKTVPTEISLIDFDNIFQILICTHNERTIILISPHSIIDFKYSWGQ